MKNRGLSARNTDRIEYDGWELIYLDSQIIEVIANNISYIDIKTKIKFCERYARQHHKRLQFKLFSNRVPESLDHILKLQHYKLENPGIIMTVSSLNSTLKSCGDFKIKFYERQHSRFHELKQSMSLQEIEVGDTACFCQISTGDTTIATAFATVYECKMGIFNVLVEASYRRHGIGECIMNAIFHWGKAAGATSAYLHVSEQNVAAIRLYQKMGFVEETRVWLRIQPVLE